METAITHCPSCGLRLKKTNFNRYFCANCGILDINKGIEDEFNHEDNSRSYIG